MPGAISGWPYPLPTEKVRDGSVAIQNLATELSKRFSDQMMVGIHTVGTFDGNGLWYAPDWRLTWGIYWSGPPAVTVMAGDYQTGSQGLPVFSVFIPHNNATQLVIRGIWANSGLVFTGNIDLYIVAAGSGKRQ